MSEGGGGGRGEGGQENLQYYGKDVQQRSLVGVVVGLSVIYWWGEEGFWPLV